MTRLGVRCITACSVVVYAIAACSLITDYSLGGDRGGVEAGGGESGTGDGTSDALPPVCTEKPCIVQLAAAGETTCARTSEGAVYCWGSGSSGVVGAGAPGDYAVPNQVTFDGPVDELSLGDWGQNGTTACARRGSLVECWGTDKDRQLGRGGDASAGRFVPVPAPVPGLGNASAIAVGSQSVCARVDGALFCWGTLYDRSVNPSPVSFPVPKPVTQIAGGRFHHCALLDSEEVACAGFVYTSHDFWNVEGGADGPGQATMAIVPGITGIGQIESPGNFACALKKSGAVLCWGRNTRGQLGRGTTEHLSPIPAPVTLPEAAKSIGIGTNHGCAILTDDTVWCWGRNGGGVNYDASTITTMRGQVGALDDGGLDEFTTTARKIAGLPSGEMSAVVGGYDHSCALTRGGAVYCWGSNTHGQLGRGKADAGPDEAPHPTAQQVLF